MTVFVNRSIPLSKESRDGWIAAGATILSRSLSRQSRQLEGRIGEGTLLNLGIPETVPRGFPVVWNDVESVRSVLTPAAIRRTMPDLIPPFPLIGQDAWFKGPGQHGEHKIRMRYEGMNVTGPDDFQVHVDGTEFRVITVGSIVVQASRKQEPVNGVRNWTWVGVGGIRNNGIIPLVKRAVALVPNGDRCVFGWDVIVGEAGAYIIEGNSSPGVGDGTAARIIRQIERTV